MANLPKLPTMNGLFTWIKTKFLKIGNSNIELYDDSASAYIENKTQREGSSYTKDIIIKSGTRYVKISHAGGGVLIYEYLYPISDNIGKLGLTAKRWKEAYFGTGGIYSDSKITVNSAIVFNLPRQSSPPANPATDDIYFDDGTNTADGKPHLRAWNGTAWEDL